MYWCNSTKQTPGIHGGGSPSNRRTAGDESCVKTRLDPCRTVGVFIIHFFSPMQSSSNVFPTHNSVHRAIRLHDEPMIGDIRPARSQDAVHVEKIARDIARQNMSTKHLVLTTGFGLNASSRIPLRLPALLLPGLRIMERLTALGLPTPEYRVYQATDFIAQTNGYPVDKARECASKMESYLRRYVKTFHGRIAGHVHFYFTQAYTEETREHLGSIIDVMRSRLARIDCIAEALSQLQECERRHSLQSNCYEQYAAANVLYSGAVAQYPLGKQHPNNAEALLPIGGASEKPFFAITSAVADLSGKRVFPMLTQLGSRPTYYAYPGDPQSVEEYGMALRSSSKDPIHRDLLALRDDGAVPDVLASLYPHAR